MTTDTFMVGNDDLLKTVHRAKPNYGLPTRLPLKSLLPATSKKSPPFTTVREDFVRATQQMGILLLVSAGVWGGVLLLDGHTSLAEKFIPAGKETVSQQSSQFEKAHITPQD